MVRRYSLARWGMAFLLLAAVAVSVAGPGTRQAQAQSVTNQWRSPQLIAGNSGVSWPALVNGDADGQVYIVWPGHSTFAPVNAGEDVIFYRAWDGESWSAAVDVLAVELGERLLLDTFARDRFGRLLLLWHTSYEFILSVADPAEADSATAWESQSLGTGEQFWGGDLVVGGDGTFHVLLAGERQRLFYLQSADAGRSWTEEVALNLGEDSNLQIQYPHLALGSDGVLHATWTEHDGRYNWIGAAVWYSRSLNNGRSWEEPTALVQAVGHGASALTADGQGHVWVFWDRSVGTLDGRYYAYSTDNGATWPPAGPAFSGISGFSGTPYFVRDGDDRLYVFTAGQGPLGSQIWQTVWDGGGWSLPVAVEVQGKLTGSEVFHVTQAGGNRLLLVWTDYGSSDIWFTRQDIAARAVVNSWLALPTVPPTPTVPPPVTPTPTAAPANLLSAESLGPPPSGPVTAISFPLVVAAGAVMLFGLGILLYRERPR